MYTCIKYNLVGLVLAGMLAAYIVQPTRAFVDTPISSDLPTHPTTTTDAPPLSTTTHATTITMSSSSITPSVSSTNTPQPSYAPSMTPTRTPSIAPTSKPALFGMVHGIEAGRFTWSLATTRWQDTCPYGTKSDLVGAALLQFLRQSIRMYEVKASDSWSSIASDHDISISALKLANGLRSSVNEPLIAGSWINIDRISPVMPQCKCPLQ